MRNKKPRETFTYAHSPQEHLLVRTSDGKNETKIMMMEIYDEKKKKHFNIRNRKLKEQKKQVQNHHELTNN